MIWYQDPFLQEYRKHLCAMTHLCCLYAGLCKSSTLQRLPAALIYASVGKLYPVLYIKFHWPPVTLMGLLGLYGYNTRIE